MFMHVYCSLYKVTYLSLLVPLQLTSATLPSAVAALGALVMPYNIFWQSWVVNARPRDKRQVLSEGAQMYFSSPVAMHATST